LELNGGCHLTKIEHRIERIFICVTEHETFGYT
jgi:hypothetical protein